MTNRDKILVCAALLAPSAALVGQAASVCPTSAVFLALPTEIRGYTTKANGPTAPCQIISGAATTLTTANQMTVSINGYLHVLQYNTNGTVDVFLPNANGNAAPNRIESVLIQDNNALATDRQVNDFTTTIEAGNAYITVTQPSTTRAEFNFVAPGVGIISGLAVDKDDNLLVAGYTNDGNAVIQTLGTSASLGAPSIVRTLSGANTGIYPIDDTSFFPATGAEATISLATDPDNGELYVYTYTSGDAPKILVFPQGASGNVAPSRVLSGSKTLIGPPAPVYTNKIAVAADGRLYVSEANETILVFAPGAKGNVAPAQTIQDSAIQASASGPASVPQGGIAVRSCTCNEPQP
jgi:hypothetical protein